MYFCSLSDITQIKELKNSMLPQGSTQQQERLFYATVDKWLHDFNRLPNADEFPPEIGVDSSTLLKQRLHIKEIGDNNITDLQTLQDYTGREDPLEMQQMLNRMHRDYNFEVIPVDDEVVIKMKKRPNEVSKGIDPIENMPVAEQAVGHLIDRINEMHGINIHEVTNKEVANIPGFPGAATLKGFVRNGEVYVNIDNSTPDTRIHELMHLFMGGIRFDNPELYQNLLNIAMKGKNVEYRLRQYRHRTEMDRAEEVLIEEVARYLSGRESAFSDLSQQDKYELDYNIRRLLDSMLDGDFSNRIIDSNELYQSTLTNVAKIVNSSEVFNNMTGTMSNSFLHRVLNNYKSDLLKKGKLKEIC